MLNINGFSSKWDVGPPETKCLGKSECYCVLIRAINLLSLFILSLFLNPTRLTALLI